MSEHVSDCARRKKEKQANVRENPAQPVASGWASSFLLLRKGKKLQAGYSLCSNHGDLTKLVQGTGCWIVHKIIVIVCLLSWYWVLKASYYCLHQDDSKVTSVICSIARCFGCDKTITACPFWTLQSKFSCAIFVGLSLNCRVRIEEVLTHQL